MADPAENCDTKRTSDAYAHACAAGLLLVASGEGLPDVARQSVGCSGSIVKDFLAEFVAAPSAAAVAADSCAESFQNERAAAPACAGQVTANSGGNAKGRTEISRVAAYFDRPINEAAQILDICPTVLKKICRRHGLKRWPNRRIRSIDKQIALLKAVIQDGYSDGDDHTRREIADQVALLEEERGRICFQIL